MVTFEKFKDILPTNVRHILAVIHGMMINCYWSYRYWVYVHLFTPIEVKRMRKKPVVNVIFVIAELGMWKTENLYQAMLAHPRFNPVLRVVSTPENDKAKEEVIAYLKNKGYDYRALDEATPLQDGFKADIIFYQKPYPHCYFKAQRYCYNLNALFCFVSYGIHNIMSDFICNQPLHNIAWQYYFENKQCAAETAKYMNNNGRNIVVTGVPLFDRFLKPKNAYKYAWKQNDASKKRIIYAPHFSIEKNSCLRYSTFLGNGDFLLEMGRKYADKVQFVFKPHPLLQPHLYEYWGKVKTDKYYAAWDLLANAKVELGQYDDLFMTSDAMIHDCSSFSIEYMFTCNPVMNLIHDRTDSHGSNLNTFARKAFDLHYKGLTHEDIEQFIQNVINGRDVLLEQRKEYFDEFLKPINCKTSVENIIAAILQPNS